MHYLFEAVLLLYKSYVICAMLWPCVYAHKAHHFSRPMLFISMQGGRSVLDMMMVCFAPRGYKYRSSSSVSSVFSTPSIRINLELYAPDSLFHHAVHHALRYCSSRWDGRSCKS